MDEERTTAIPQPPSLEICKCTCHKNPCPYCGCQPRIMKSFITPDGEEYNVFQG